MYPIRYPSQPPTLSHDSTSHLHTPPPPHRCQDTLTKTVYLHENMHSLDAAFAEGTTAHIASEIVCAPRTLHSHTHTHTPQNKMQTALKAVKGFGQYEQIASNIAQYEERLQDMVETECVDALVNRDREKAKLHLATLKKIGRLNEILVQYTKRAVEGTSQEWKDFEKANPPGEKGGEWEAGLLQFLSGFNDRLEQSLASSRRYYQDVFGADAPQMALEYYTMVQRDSAHAQNRYFTRTSLVTVVACYQSSTRLRHSLLEAHFPSPPAAGGGAEAEAARRLHESQVTMLQQAASGPYQHLQSLYPSLEEEGLLARINSFRFVKDLEQRERNIKINPTTVLEMNEGTSTLLHECQLAVERCAVFTLGEAGTQAKALELIERLNGVLIVLCGRVREVVGRLRSALGLATSDAAPAAAAAAADYDPVKLKLTLQLHHAATGVVAKVALFEQWLYEFVAGLKHTETTASLKGFAENSAAAAQGGAAPAHTTGLLAAAKTEARSLEEAVGDIVFDLLFTPVSARLRGVPAMPVYAVEEGQEGASMGYHGTPMEYLPMVGDYLLGLPEALGQATGGMDNDESTTKEWINLVLTRTAKLFMQMVLSLPQLSACGMRQLGTDVEYLENVMCAFDLDTPSLRALLFVLTSFSDDFAAIKDDVLSLDPKGEEMYNSVKEKRKAADEGGRQSPEAEKGAAPAATPAPQTQ